MHPKRRSTTAGRSARRRSSRRKGGSAAGGDEEETPAKRFAAAAPWMQRLTPRRIARGVLLGSGLVVGLTVAIVSLGLRGNGVRPENSSATGADRMSFTPPPRPDDDSAGDSALPKHGQVVPATATQMLL